jgi:stage II sporulation protein D
MFAPIRHRAPSPLAVVSAVLLTLFLVFSVLPADAAQPSRFRFSGGGFGHGIGMSQYGAYGMALRGKKAGEILRFYYGGAKVSRASFPRNLRVGLLQNGIGLSMVPQALTTRGAAMQVSGMSRYGRIVKRSFAGGATYKAVPSGGGVAVYKGARKVYGPTLARHALIVRYEGGRRPATLRMPAIGRTLRYGYLELGNVSGGLRAVATMGWNSYLRGLGEVPSLWPLEAQKAQAVAARSYALAVVRASGQYRGRYSASGCSCGVLSDTRDQNFVGWSKEAGTGGGRWISAVMSTSGKVVTYGGKLVRAYYSSSSGGYTASNAVWGSRPLPYYPAKRDPYDSAGGRNPNATWAVTKSAASVNRAMARYGVGSVTSIRVARVDRSGRATRVVVSGTRKAVTISGDRLRSAFGLKSTKIAVKGLP